MLLEAHTRLTRLASTMDVNDFNHVNCTYLPRSSGSGSQFEIIPVDIPLPSTAAPARRPRPAALMPPSSTVSVEVAPLALPSPPPSARADFDVSQTLSERSPLIGSGLDEPFNQYGSQLPRDKEDSPVSEENVVSPGRHRSSPLRPSPRVSPPHPSSTGGGVPVQYEDVDLLSQPEVASSTAQVIDTEAPASPTRPASNVAGQIQETPTMEEIAVVAPSVVEVEVINYSDIDSCNSKGLLGDSIDEDINDDDDGVNEGVPLPVAPALELNAVDPALAPPTNLMLVLSLLPQPLQLLRPFQQWTNFTTLPGRRRIPSPSSLSRSPVDGQIVRCESEGRPRRGRIAHKSCRGFKRRPLGLQNRMQPCSGSSISLSRAILVQLLLHCPQPQLLPSGGRRCTRWVGVILGCVCWQVRQLLLRPLHPQCLLGLFVPAVLSLVQAGVSFILDPKIIPLRPGRCFKHQRTLFDFRSRRRWMQPIQLRVSKGCHSMTLGI